MPAPGTHDPALQDNENHRLLFAVYPELFRHSSPQWDDTVTRAKLFAVPEKTLLMRENMPCTDFLLLLEGAVRVYQLAEDGREVTLYRIHPGDICVMSLRSLVSNKMFPANAVTETAVRALAIPAVDFHHALAQSASFRNRVLGSVAESFCDMITTVQNTVFQRLDMRLACLLGRLFERNQSDVLRITHLELANELGTTREVVSRILKHLEKQGCIRLARGQIEVVSSEGLQWFRGNP